MTKGEWSEMVIPHWSGEVIFGIALCVVLVVATLVAVLNLFLHIAIIASCVWLAIMALWIWSNCKGGGYRQCLHAVVGLFARRHFVESERRATGAVEIRFGYRCFGRRFFDFRVPLDKIETVEWSPGQAPEYWRVSIWFDHGDPEKSLRERQWSRKPDQDVYCVGPSRRKRRTEAFGLALVDFLRRAGAVLVPGEDDCTFVRAVSGKRENVEPPPS